MSFRANRKLTAAVCLAFTVSACSTINPYTGEKQTAKASTGSAIGALAGALIGAATASKKDRKKAALIGAGVGAVAGGGVGYYMDVQEAKLRQELESTGVSVQRKGNNIILNMPGNITFESGSDVLNPSFHKTLGGVIKVLAEYKSTLVTVSGFTDSTGSAGKNQKLSERRAASVASYLAQNGIQKERLAAIGYGESQPIATNKTAEGRAQNRRVELALEPIEEEK